VKLFHMDYTSPETLRKQLQDGPQFDYVIHNAGLTKSLKNSDYSLVNAQYTRHLIEGLIAARKVPAKFIYVSSLAAFGPGDSKTLEPVKLTDTPKPLTAYGRSKLEAEQYITTLNQFPYLIFRPTAVYGPRERDLYLYFKMINNNFESYIGSPKQLYTFIYVKDLVKAIFAGMESELTGRSYFVADGNIYPSQVFADTIKKGLSKKTFRLVVPLPLVKAIGFSLEALYGIGGRTPILNSEKISELSSVNWKCDLAPLERDLNFRADYNLEKGVNETVEWYKREKWL
jgi:nucleoside-diphosphate-sugar epimerase